MRAGCCTKITIRSRMETVSVPSESTLRYAVGDFKPQLIVARKSLPPPSGEVRPAHVFFFTVCPLRAGRSVGEAAAAAGPARGLARRRRRPPQLTRKICRVVRGDIERSATSMPHFQSEGRVPIGPSNPPLPHGRGHPRNRYGEARRRRHGVSGMPVTNTPTSSQIDPHRVESDNSDFYRGRRPTNLNPTACNCYLERRRVPAFG